MASGRTKRVLLYTASLLAAPLPAMPSVKGTRGYVLAIMAWGAILALSSAYVLQGEIKLRSHSLLGKKLIAASLVTLLAGLSMLVGSVVYLAQY